jgi:homoserine dehydrogenase
MDTAGLSLEDAMVEATDLGYLEADPSLDVEGYDAAQKIAILASLAFHTEVPLEKVYREGITKISREQMTAARDNGYVIKLLAICERLDEGVSARVYPALIPREHPLAAVRGAFNAVFVEAEAAGALMFYGSGAGGTQTASAVLGDLVSAAKRHVAGGPGLADSVHADLEVLPIDHVFTRYQITLEAKDRPGVLASIAATFADHGVSVETVEQSINPRKTATLMVGTHEATESSLQSVVQALAASDAVESITSVIRVEGI